MLVLEINIRCFILDIDECETGTHDCETNSSCINKYGSYACLCSKGYVRTGNMCILYNKMFPYGPANGDDALPTNVDDGHVEIRVSREIKFKNTMITKWFVCI